MSTCLILGKCLVLFYHLSFAFAEPLKKTYLSFSILPIFRFPPKLFKQLGEMFNRSESPYLICYHGPKLMVERYGFNVELIVQSSTSMHGSSECHMGYLYRRVGVEKKRVGLGNKNLVNKENQINQENQNDKDNQKPKTPRRQKKVKDTRVLLDGKIKCDPLFVSAWNSTRRELTPLLEDVKSQVASSLSSQRPRRTRRATTRYQN